MSASLRHDSDAAPMDAPRWMRRPKPAAPGDIETPRFIGDRGMIELRRRLALDPAAVPQPPLDPNAGRSVDRLALRFCAVVAVAALAAWAVVSYSRARLPANEVRQARVVPAMTASKVKLGHTAAATPRLALGPVDTPAIAQVAFAAKEKTAAPVIAAPPSQQQTLQFAGISIAIKTPEPVPPAASASAAVNKPALAPDEIATLVKRGKAFITDGDVVAARLLLQRAAEAGSAEAAFALGASFDPLIIKQARAIGVQADAAQARHWYQTAATLGSDLASKQLANLATAGQ